MDESFYAKKNDVIDKLSWAAGVTTRLAARHLPSAIRSVVDLLPANPISTQHQDSNLSSLRWLPTAKICHLRAKRRRTRRGSSATQLGTELFRGCPISVARSMMTSRVPSSLFCSAPCSSAVQSVSEISCITPFLYILKGTSFDVARLFYTFALLLQNCVILIVTVGKLE